MASQALKIRLARRGAPKRQGGTLFGAVRENMNPPTPRAEKKFLALKELGKHRYKTLFVCVRVELQTPPSKEAR